MLNITRKGGKAPQGRRLATLEISKAASLPRTERARLAKWLKSQADLLLQSGAHYAPKFKGEYLA